MTNKIHSITRDNKEIGYIQVIPTTPPQLEYRLDSEWHNQGIMTKEINIFLDSAKSQFPNMIAVVKKDNAASIRVLEKVGFVKFKNLREYFIFLYSSDEEKRKWLTKIIDSGLEGLGFKK